MIGKTETILSKSPLHITAPVGYTDQADFANAIIKIETTKTPQELHSVLCTIETTLGKNIAFKNGPRTIDLDIIFYGSAILETPDLQIPHPRAHMRKFVLEPLAELDPEFVHPVLKKTIRELLGQLF